MQISIWNARDEDARRKWLEAFSAWPTREVFAHPSYVSLFARPDDEPLAAYVETARGFVLYPFVLRPIDAPHLKTGTEPAYDLTSAYGYAGAFSTGLSAEEAGQFWAAFDGWCTAKGVVAEFARLSLFEEQRLVYPGAAEQKLTNVVRDLSTPEDVMWREFDHKVRKNVNKARRSDVSIEVDETGARLDDFLRIYETTMDRREAKSSFYFPRGFFETIVRELEGQFVFFHALKDGRVVSTELVLVSVENTYSYLGGTEQAYFDLRPNDLLKFEIFRWGRAKGKRRFVLGGGYAPDDGIFRYKRAFAPDGLFPYFVGTRVFDTKRYEMLVSAHSCEARRRSPDWKMPVGFFPAYRCELP
jgi:hypothetical protein